MKLIIYVILISVILFSNELKNSTSPYLLQHKDNPVNWMKWSNRAFTKAKKENKFIFLSIGYSTCHWCHVMAKESFSKEEVAKVLNKNFVSIKVDKERLSHIDSYYQMGYRLTNSRSGGWPLTVILLPNKKPIFFATYMPKDALIDILNQIVNTKKDKLKRIGNSIETLMKRVVNKKLPTAKIPNNLIIEALNGYKAIYDYKYKGFSVAPKFPQASSIDMLLNIYTLTEKKEALNMATQMLIAMAKGGIYDQIEGGFFRYSVDAKWQIPHFEKMLYTNAELISTYAKAYKITKNPLFAKVVKGTIANIENYFNHNGLYYSASNADSKNEDGIDQEGYYYVYEYTKVLEFLIKNGVKTSKAKEALAHFGIESMGNFEGGDYSHSKIVGKKEGFKKEQQLLAKYRKTKEYPFIDKKINTAWNALYIKALFDATVVDKKFTKMATDRLNKLLKLMYRDGLLFHQTLLPNKPKQLGLLEDYAFVLDALFTAYETTLDSNYLQLYKKIVKKSVKLFYKNDNWYLNSNGKIKVRTSFYDGSYKSAVSLMIKNLLKTVALNGDFKLLKIAKQTIKSGSIYLTKEAYYYPTLLNSALILKEGLFVIKGQRDSLINLNLDDIIYPYIYKKSERYSVFQICGLQSCYKSFKDATKIKKELKVLFKTAK